MSKMGLFLSMLAIAVLFLINSALKEQVTVGGCFRDQIQWIAGTKTFSAESPCCKPHHVQQTSQSRPASVLAFYKRDEQTDNWFDSSQVRGHNIPLIVVGLNAVTK